VINTDGDVDGASEFAIVGDTVISPDGRTDEVGSQLGLLVVREL